MDAAVPFVMRYGATGDPDRRPLYDIESVDATIVNAVAHRDYSICGAKIRLLPFANRLASRCGSRVSQRAARSHPTPPARQAPRPFTRIRPRLPDDPAR